MHNGPTQGFAKGLSPLVGVAWFKLRPSNTNNSGFCWNLRGAETAKQSRQYFAASKITGAPKNY